MSHAEKRRAKLGARARRQGPREPNGRINRAWDAPAKAEDAMQTAREARQRHFGWMSDDQARSEYGGSAVGRLHIQGHIQLAQYVAARNYMEVRNEYQRAIGVTPDYNEPRASSAGSAMDQGEWAEHAKKRHASMHSMLKELQISMRSPAPRAALDVIVVRDMDFPEGVGDLRIALNALDRHFAGEKQAMRAA